MSVFLCVGIGILLTVLALLLVIPMLHVLKTPTDIFDGASSYLFTMFAGTLIVMAYNMASAILRAFGDGKTPLIAMGIAASANIVLDLLFVLVFGLGIVGAAIATLIAQLISFLYCLTIIRKIDFIKTQRNDWQWDSRIVYELCAMGFTACFDCHRRDDTAINNKQPRVCVCRWVYCHKQNIWVAGKFSICP